MFCFAPGLACRAAGPVSSSPQLANQGDIPLAFASPFLELPVVSLPLLLLSAALSSLLSSRHSLGGSSNMAPEKMPCWGAWALPQCCIHP